MGRKGTPKAQPPLPEATLREVQALLASLPLSLLLGTLHWDPSLCLGLLLPCA